MDRALTLGGRRTTSSVGSDWFIPAGLVVLSLVPVLAGTARLVQLANGAAVTPDNARFVHAPLPVTLHIVSVTVYALLGAFQFWPSFRKRQRRWHRLSGRVLVPAGLVAALSGLWMAEYYPWPPLDGVALYLMRLVVGTAMAGALVRGMMAILRRDVARHEAWMLRAYALGLGAGTQVLTHIPFFVFPAIQGELSRALCMGSAWAINLAVAEWLIARRGRRLAPAPRGRAWNDRLSATARTGT
jgi:uncharacterized membrane protein